MTKKICGHKCHYDERLMICRRSPDHEGDHSYTTFRSQHRPSPPEIPAGDYEAKVVSVQRRKKKLIITFRITLNSETKEIQSWLT